MFPCLGLCTVSLSSVVCQQDFSESYRTIILMKLLERVGFSIKKQMRHMLQSVLILYNVYADEEDSMVLEPWRSIISEDGAYYYLRQGGYVLPGVCLCVCLSVC